MIEGIITCDVCKSNTMKGNISKSELRRQANEAGWRHVRLNRMTQSLDNIKYYDVCPDCEVPRIDHKPIFSRNHV